MPEIVDRVLDVRQAEDVETVRSLVREHNLPREVIPTEFLNDVGVWEAMLPKMPMTAMIRNLGKMTSIGVLKDWNENTNTVLSKLGDSEILKKARIHPLSILVALNTYASGQGFRGSLQCNQSQRSSMLLIKLSIYPLGM